MHMKIISNAYIGSKGRSNVMNCHIMSRHVTSPLLETVALVEDIVVEYVTDMVHKAQDIASKRGKLLTEYFLFLIRKDLPKLNRCKELLLMNEELKYAREAFHVDEEKMASAE
ncbi:putative transcription factor Hap3/NF-YB family [Helianthus annuus]|nr:putative transcription factor Hap3/NF-YB family [Helianthus annuus]KAJ0755801.1 putative transcription factor Hap3/NF-YB family [Helianthus annuus]